MSVVMTGG